MKNQRQIQTADWHRWWSGLADAVYPAATPVMRVPWPVFVASNEAGIPSALRSASCAAIRNNLHIADGAPPAVMAYCD